MKASLQSVRIAPKKANLIAKMVRGKSVLEAISMLERTNKKAARLLQSLVESAVANASHNEGQQPESLVIRTLTVNKAQAYHRGVPMARGRIRPMRKFLSHIHLTLGIADEVGESGEKKEKVSSQSASKPVKSKRSPAKTGKASQGKGATSKQTTSSSKNSAA